MNLKIPTQHDYKTLTQAKLDELDELGEFKNCHSTWLQTLTQQQLDELGELDESNELDKMGKFNPLLNCIGGRLVQDFPGNVQKL